MSNKTHTPLQKNNKWMKAPSIYAEKTYAGVLPYSLIGKSHMGHQPEPTARAAGSPHPHTLIGWGGSVPFSFRSVR